MYTNLPKAALKLRNMESHCSTKFQGKELSTNKFKTTFIEQGTIEALDHTVTNFINKNITERRIMKVS